MRELNPDGVFRILCGFRPEQSITKRFLMPEEVERLFYFLKDRDKAIVRLILEHGLSLNEVLELGRDNYDGNRGVLVVADRDVALSDQLRRFLEVLDEPRFFELGERSVHKILARACEAAEIQVATSRDLRRTFAVYFLAAGGGIDVLSSVMGMTVGGMVKMLGIQTNGIDDVPAHRAFAIIFGDDTPEHDGESN